MTIKFGTDGWRAVIAEEYTFANVRKVCAGAGKALRGAGDGAVVVGYDTRFLSRRFAAEKVLPTPVDSFPVLGASC